MLIKCQECELQVSDKAIACPHCGFPLRPNAVQTPRKRMNKRRRLPNGFGQISEIKNQNLRKPFRAMVTVGKTPTGRPICKPLKPDSYFETYNDAYAALVEYNRNPYDLQPSMTVKELYEKWSVEYFQTLKSKSSERSITSSWAFCSSIYDMRVLDVRARHIKGCMEEGIAVVRGENRSPSAGAKVRIKSMFNLMLDYAVEYEMIDRNYARTFNISDDTFQEKEKNRKEHIPLTEDEMQILWNSVDTNAYVDIILIQSYSGWRPQELGLIRLENVDLNNWTFIGGMKTDAGENRLVPIHPKIRHLVEHRYNEAIEIGSEYLFNCTEINLKRGNLKLTYDKYRHRFDKVMSDLGLSDQHRPHDPRIHFVTMAKKYKVDEYAIKRMVGHAISDITERVYTHRDIEWLKTEMKKIK